MLIDSSRITAEQLRLLFAALPFTLSGSIINATILVAVLWSAVPSTHLLTWLGIFLVINLLRGLLLLKYRRQAPDKPHSQQTWIRSFLLSTLLTGLAWGSVSLFLFPLDSVPHQAFIAFVMAGNNAAAIISLSYLRQMALAFVLPTLLPLIVQFFLLQTTMSTAMGTMVSLFLLICLSGIRRTYQSTLQNITLRLESVEHEKAILASQQRLALHVQQTPLAVIEWTTDFEVVNWNPAAEKIFGYTKSEALGKHGTELLVPDTARAAVDEVWAALLTQKGGLQSSNDNITKDGRTISCEWYNTPLVNEQGQVIGVASLAQDITERKKVEQMQNDFISTVSHELRTPLTSIRGAMEILTGGVLQTGSDEYKHVLEIAKNNAGRLLLLINDILDIQKIESGKMEFNFQSVEVQPFLAQAVEANHAYAKQHGVHYQLHNGQEALIARADPDRLMQVMNNLLSNAAKFSHPGQNVEIEAHKHDGMARITVIDHGWGISDEFVEHVFERFARADSSNTRQTGGTGLGLSIVKNIIEQHDGKVTFETQPGRGTRFYVDLPLV